MRILTSALWISAYLIFHYFSTLFFISSVRDISIQSVINHAAHGKVKLSGFHIHLNLNPFHPSKESSLRIKQLTTEGVTLKKLKVNFNIFELLTIFNTWRETKINLSGKKGDEIGIPFLDKIIKSNHLIELNTKVSLGELAVHSNEKNKIKKLFTSERKLEDVNILLKLKMDTNFEGDNTPRLFDLDALLTLDKITDRDPLHKVTINKAKTTLHIKTDNLSELIKYFEKISEEGDGVFMFSSESSRFEAESSIEDITFQSKEIGNWQGKKITLSNHPTLHGNIESIALLNPPLLFPHKYSKEDFLNDFKNINLKLNIVKLSEQDYIINFKIEGSIDLDFTINTKNRNPFHLYFNNISRSTLEYFLDIAEVKNKEKSPLLAPQPVDIDFPLYSAHY